MPRMRCSTATDCGWSAVCASSGRQELAGELRIYEEICVGCEMSGTMYTSLSFGCRCCIAEIMIARGERGVRVIVMLSRAF